MPCYVYVYLPNVTLVMGAGKGSGGENYVNPVVKYMLFFSHIIFWVSRLRLLVVGCSARERGLVVEAGAFAKAKTRRQHKNPAMITASQGGVCWRTI